jgi:hypothetical protein
MDQVPHFAAGEENLKGPHQNAVGLTSSDEEAELGIMVCRVSDGVLDSDVGEGGDDEGSEEDDAWETESLYQDALKEIGDDQLLDGAGISPTSSNDFL